MSYYENNINNHTATGASLMHATEAVRMPEVISESQELKSDIEHIAKLVTEVEARFAGVLRPVEPQAECDNSPRPVDPTSPMALDLRQMRFRTESIRQNLQQILSRCECG